jgi:hypothetical protein
MALLAAILLVLVLLGVSALAALFAIASEAEVLPERAELRTGEPRAIRKDGAQTLRLVHRAQ